MIIIKLIIVHTINNRCMKTFIFHLNDFPDASNIKYHHAGGLPNAKDPAQPVAFNFNGGAE